MKDADLQPSDFTRGVTNMERPKVTKKQVLALKLFIEKSREMTDFAKKTVIWMIEKTDLFTKSGCVIFKPEKQELGQEAVEGIFKIISLNGMTHVGLFLTGMGLEPPDYRIYSHRVNGDYHLYIAAGQTCQYDSWEPDFEAILRVNLDQLF